MSIALNVEGPSLNVDGPSHCPSSSTDEFLRSLMISRELDEVSDQQEPPMLPRVPSGIREMKENMDCYEPQVVSIGPYHHGKKELEKMEKLKTEMARQFFKDRMADAEEMYRKVKELVNDARGCYAEELTHQFNDEKFAQMMFIDGYFILQVVSNNLDKQNLKHEVVASVKRDLFLLENQLPFRVLISLRLSLKSEDQNLTDIFERFFRDIRAMPPQRMSCRETISNFFPKLPGALASLKSPRFDEDFYHLLDFFYFEFIYGKRYHNDRGTRWPREITSWNRYHSVKELKKVGISFMPSNSKIVTDVSFKQTLLGGAIHIPPLSIDDSTKPLLLNLVAHETFVGWNSGKLTSYLCFMRSMIDEAEDVKELRSQGILRTTMGSDDQIARIFKEMTTNLVPNPYAFMKIKIAVESQYRSTLKRWILDYRAPISTAVVKYSFLYGFMISAIQAYVAETEKPGSGNCSCTNSTQLHH